jgi:hypothetical protein
MYAASRKWVSSSGSALLNMAAHGSTFVGSPFAPMENPAGAFIHEFTEMMEVAPMMATNGIGKPNQKCVHGFMRRQPYM